MRGVELERVIPEGYPFLTPDCGIGESRNSSVLGYDNGGSPLVVKINSGINGEVTFTRTDQARSYIRHKVEERETVCNLLKEMGYDADKILPYTASIIHEERTGAVTFSRIQRWFQGAKTLKEFGLVGVFGLSSESLVRLKDIFGLTLRFWGKEKSSLDLLGSTNKAKTIFTKGLRQMAPVFFLENVVIDTSGNPVIIDLAKFDEESCQNFEMRARRLILVIGAINSIAIISGVLTYRRLKEKFFSSVPKTI